VSEVLALDARWVAGVGEERSQARSEFKIQKLAHTGWAGWASIAGRYGPRPCWQDVSWTRRNWVSSQPGWETERFTFHPTASPTVARRPSCAGDAGSVRLFFCLLVGGDTGRGLIHRCPDASFAGVAVGHGGGTMG
jgi:hypothetical protein